MTRFEHKLDPAALSFSASLSRSHTTTAEAVLAAAKRHWLKALLLTVLVRVLLEFYRSMYSPDSAN